MSVPISAPSSGSGSATTVAAAVPAPYRRTIFFAVILGANLQVLDTTMATVALTRMQGALSATQDEITWVLASYLIAVAIVMPLVGTLAARLGRRRLFLGAIIGFCIASMLSGSADNLSELVVYRFLQGIFASPLTPISQSFVFDSFPAENRGKAMSWWSLGVMIGVLSGPAIGGYLTEFHSWRWVFYINIPIGILSFVLIYIFGPRYRPAAVDHPFGWVGFLILAVGLVSMQIVLSRGERMDWFSSTQIVFATGLAVAFLYTYIVHSAVSDHPFIPPAIFTDRNFSIGLVLMLMLGVHWLAFIALVSPYLQTMAGFPVVTAGLVLVPQGIANAVSSFLAGRLLGRLQAAPMMILGVFLMAWAYWQLASFTPEFDRLYFYVVVMAHGAGLGLYFVPLTVVTFSTLPSRYTDVGTGLYALMRNFGSSIGVSLVITYLVRTTRLNHARLSENVSPFNEALRHRPLPEAWSMVDPSTLAILDAEATRQAAAMAYCEDFRWLAFAILALIPLIMMVRLPPHLCHPYNAVARR
jgi:MFS transporter, DHA2 family, multidrug resistance protein